MNPLGIEQRHPDKDAIPRIVYMAGVDVSRDNGAGVNERGFVRAVAAEPDIVCVLPSPAFPGNYRDDRHRYVFGHRGAGWRIPLYMIGLALASFRLSRQCRIGGVVVRIGLTSLVPLWLARCWRVPLFLKTHSGRDSYGQVPWRTLLFSRGKWNRQMLRVRVLDAIFKPLEQAVIRRASVIDCPSATCRDVVAAEPGMEGKQVVAIPNGADIEFYRPCDPRRIRSRLGISPEAFVVGYAGAIGGEVRFLDVLLEALIRLGGRTPVVGLMLGHGPSLETFQARVKAAGMEGSILFPGFVPNREIPEWISAMDLAADMTAVSLSLRGETVHASYSQKIAQYLACGVPVLAWDLPDTRFLQRQGIGFLAPLQDRDSLANTVEAALGEAEPERAARRRRAREYAAQHLSYAALASTRLRLWRAALNPRERQRE